MGKSIIVALLGVFVGVLLSEIIRRRRAGRVPPALESAFARAGHLVDASFREDDEPWAVPATAHTSSTRS